MSTKTTFSGDTIDKIIMDPAFIETSIKVMEMEPDIDEDFLVPFTEDEQDEEGNAVVKERDGDYGDTIKYVPIKYIRQRADAAFKKKYSFLIIGERREDNPFERKRWNKQDEEYEVFDGDKYIKCIGMMIVPGLGIRMEYGVKKVRGGAESSDWKACKADAFKKCCEAFGIYLDYETDDSDEEDNIPKKSNGKGGGKKGKDIDLSEVEYDDDELAEAMEYAIDFGKYDGYTLGELVSEDESYVEWLVEKAREEEMREMAAIVLKSVRDEEDSKASRSKNRRGSSKTSSSKTGNKSGNSTTRKSESTSKTGGSSKGGEKLTPQQQRKKDKLLAVCEEALEDYDTVQARSVIQSVSVSNEFKKGKTKLEQLTLRELEELTEVLAEDE